MSYYTIKGYDKRGHSRSSTSGFCDYDETIIRAVEMLEQYNIVKVDVYKDDILIETHETSDIDRFNNPSKEAYSGGNMELEEAKANPGLIVEIEFSVSWQRDPKKGAVARGQQSEDTLTLQSLVNPEAFEIIPVSQIKSITSTGKYAFEPVLAKKTKRSIRDSIFDFADEIEKL